MIDTMFLVPRRDNSGRLFPARSWTELHGRLGEFGGFNRTDNVVGSWRSPDGVVYQDRLRRYEIGLHSWRQMSAWLGLVDWVRIEFRQEAIYGRAAGVPEVFSAP